MVRIYYAPTDAKTASHDARRMSEQAYRQLTDQAESLQKEPSGRPFFPTRRYHVSISHTKRMVFAALCEEPVGIDVEQPRKIAPILLRRCLSPAERLQLAQSGQPELLFLRFWTLKEAYLKYTGEGIRRIPNHLSFTLEGASASLKGSPLQFQTVTVGDAIISVCTQDREQISLQAVCLPEQIADKTEQSGAKQEAPQGKLTRAE